MIAFSNVSEYLYTSSKAGIRVTLHKHTYAAFPNTEGYNVGVGSYVAIAVQHVSPHVSTSGLVQWVSVPVQ